MNTAITIPDELYVKAEEFARMHSTSRDAVIADALQEYLARRKTEAIIAEIKALVDELGQPADRVQLSAAARILKQTEW